MKNEITNIQYAIKFFWTTLYNEFHMLTKVQDIVSLFKIICLFITGNANL